MVILSPPITLFSFDCQCVCPHFGCNNCNNCNEGCFCSVIAGLQYAFCQSVGMNLTLR